MKTRPIIRLLTAGFRAATLAACGDGRRRADGGHRQQYRGGVTTDDSETAWLGRRLGQRGGPTTTSPTTGMGMSDTQATTEGTTTEAETGTSSTTEVTRDDDGGVEEPVRRRHAGGRRGVRRRQRRAGRRLRAELRAVGGVRQRDQSRRARRATTATPRTATSAAPTARSPRRRRMCGNGAVQEPEAVRRRQRRARATAASPTAPCHAGRVRQRRSRTGEQCDDGNDVDGGPGDFCKNDCTPFFPASCSAPADYVVCDDALDLGDKVDKTQRATRRSGICNAQADDSMPDHRRWSFDAVAQPTSWQVAQGLRHLHATITTCDANTPPQAAVQPA